MPTVRFPIGAGGYRWPRPRGQAGRPGSDGAAVSVTAVPSLLRPVRAVLDPWPTGAVVAELRRRQAALVASLDGTVLELHGPPAESPAVADGATFDHVVTAGWLGASDDLDGALADLVEAVGPDGWLHAVEPSLSWGATARAQHLGATVGRQRTGWRVDRDIPAAIRRAGFVVTDLERFSMPVPSVVLRPWVACRARRRRPLPFDAPATGEAR